MEKARQILLRTLRTVAGGKKFSATQGRLLSAAINRLASIYLLQQKAQKDHDKAEPKTGSKSSKNKTKSNSKKEKKPEPSQSEPKDSSKGKSTTPDFGSYFQWQNPFPGFDRNLLNILFALGITFGGYALWKELNTESYISTAELISKIKQKEVARLVVVKDHPESPSGKIKAYGDGNRKLGAVFLMNVENFLKQVEESQKMEPGDHNTRKVAVEYSSWLMSDKYTIVLGIAALAVYLLLRRKPPSVLGNKSGNRNGLDKIRDLFNVGSSRAVEYGAANKVNVNFKDVAGLEGPKQEIQEVVEFLKSPKKFRDLGAKIPKGVLMVGPPGTGKTLLAKACAGEAGVAFFAASGSEFVELYVGVGAARVRDMFKKAKAKSPAIIFIDEIDAVGKRRNKIASNDERESTMNQMFVEMDGFGTDSNVIVLAATNRKETLDPALIRPGRFDRLVEINLPTISEREQIFGVHLRNLKTAPTLTKPEIAKRLSALTTGMSGADIMSICNEAALFAARKNKNAIELADFYEAYDRVFTGLKRNLPLKEFDRKVTAFHEAGHAVAGWFLKHTQQILKVSIVPRSKGSLGHTAIMADEIELYTKEQLYDMLKLMYAGRAAEEVFLGTTTTGAADDFSKATALAKKYVGSFGMSEGFGKMIFGSQGEGIWGRDRGSSYSRKKFDKEVIQLCNEAYKEVKKLLENKKQEVTKLATALLNKETVELDELTTILGERQTGKKEELSEYLKDLKEKKGSDKQPEVLLG